MVWKWLHCSAVREDPPNISNLCSAVTMFLPPLFHSLSSFYTIHPPFLFALALFAHVFPPQYKYPELEDVWCLESRHFFYFCRTPKKKFQYIYIFFFLEPARGHRILEATFWHQMNKWLHNNWHNALIFISSCLGAFVNLEWRGDEWPYSRKTKWQACTDASLAGKHLYMIKIIMIIIHEYAWHSYWNLIIGP